jgi:Ca-activated chloride channel family protein
MDEQEYKPDYKLERWITLILALLFLIPFVASAQEARPELPGPMSLNQVQHGSLLLKTTQPGLYVPALTLRTSVEIRVSGMIVRARVIQQFQNPADQCAEGVYVFPLPENSAVDTLRMTIGNRRIEGQIKEREEARRVYEQARREGRKASLLEQQRPNIFTVSVASLLPREEAQIEIEYQQIADYRDGEFRLRFPMLVGPRYTPGGQGTGERVLGAGAFSTVGSDSGNPVSLRIDLRAGVPLRRVESTYHPINRTALSPDHYEVTLAEGEVPANRDFELVWQPDIGREPRAAVFSETVGGETYALVMMVPPMETAAPVRVPRETIFIIDTSGSMEGESIKQAREALVLALQGLDSADTFNIIEFDSDTHVLFAESRPADPSTVADAIAFVESLAADDGTEMLPAIAAALQMPGAASGRVRQVIFMTDGQVSNEAQLFQYIRANLGVSRLFTVGIGSTPNSHFMRQAAQIGRGTFTYIGDLSEVKTKMGELFRKLDHPVLTDLEVRFDDATAEVWPSRLPDVYVGEPLLVTARLSSGGGGVALAGRAGAGEVRTLSRWTDSLSLQSSSSESGIGKLWARRKIESLDDSVTAGADPQQIRSEIVQVALGHHLVSQHTSLVAVDLTPTGIDSSRCVSQLLPLNEPKGWGERALAGSLPQTATPAPLLLLIGVLLALMGVALWRF